MAKVSYTAATLATEVGTNPKALRVFLRTPESGVEPVGKGGRYSLELTATQLAKFKKNFKAHEEARAAAKAAREAELAQAKESHPATLTADLDFSEVDDEEPTAGMLTDEDFTDMIAEIAAEDSEVETDEVGV